MKFVYFGYDFLLDSALRLIEEGHELAGIFSFNCDNIFNFNHKTAALAKDLDIPYSTKKPLAMDIEAYIEQGVQCFFSAGYLYKIPGMDQTKAYAINFHPSLLPKGRGIMPTPTILMDNPHASGFTIHKLTERFDAGDILVQKKLPLSEHDDVETLCARISMHAPDVVSKVFSNMQHYWNAAQPQDEMEATTFPKPDEAMRMLDWYSTVENLARKGRAFGRFGCLGHFDGRLWAIYNFAGWKENHDLEPGSVAHVMSREVVIAVTDGYVVLKEFQQVGL